MFRYLAEKQTDGSHESGKILVKKLQESCAGLPANFMFALKSGDIAYLSLVKYPIRKYNVVHGAYPKKGHLAENSWTGFVPLSELPWVVNPEKGYLVSANNFITKSNVKHGISHAFTFATRAIRIGEMIEERLERKLTGEDMAVMHNDTLDIMARDSMQAMLQVVL